MAWNDRDKIKILMTADTVGGVWTYAVDLMKSLLQHNVHFHLVSAGNALSDVQKEQLQDAENVTLHETTFKLEWMHDPWHDIDSSGCQLLKWERELKPDIIHLNSYSYGALPFSAPKIVVAHSDVYSWWTSVKKSFPGPSWKEYFRRVKEGLMNSQVVVAPTYAMLKMLSAIYGENERSMVIYNGRDSKLFSPANEKEGIMCAGRLWDEAKNLHLISHAAQYINGNIRVAGDIKAGDEISGHDNVYILGKIDEWQMARELSRALVYAAPAKYEPFGLSVLEAAMCGCALVLGNIASLRELWKDTAIYVNTDDESSFANTCNFLLCNPSEATELGKKAQQRAFYFSLEQMGMHYAALYRELLSEEKKIDKMQISLR